MRVKEGGAPLKAHHVPGVLSLAVPCSSLIHMTLLNIVPLAINTHTQTGPALQFPQASATPPCLLLTLGKHCWSRQRKEVERKKEWEKHTYIQGERKAKRFKEKIKEKGRK